MSVAPKRAPPSRPPPAKAPPSKPAVADAPIANQHVSEPLSSATPDTAPVPPDPLEEVENEQTRLAEEARVKEEERQQRVAERNRQLDEARQRQAARRAAEEESKKAQQEQLAIMQDKEKAMLASLSPGQNLTASKDSSTYIDNEPSSPPCPVCGEQIDMLPCPELDTHKSNRLHRLLQEEQEAHAETKRKLAEAETALRESGNANAPQAPDFGVPDAPDAPEAPNAPDGPPYAPGAPPGPPGPPGAPGDPPSGGGGRGDFLAQIAAARKLKSTGGSQASSAILAPAPSGGGRGDLMAELAAGRKLRSVQRDEKPALEARPSMQSDLLAALQGGVKLRKSSDRPGQSGSADTAMGGMQSELAALQKARALRQGAH